MRTHRRLAVAALSLVLVAAACGSDDSSSSDTTAAAATTTAASTDTTAAASSDTTAAAGTDTTAAESSDTTAAAAPSGDPIVLGMDEDSTGPGASYSTIAGATIRDAVDQLNANGGILGRPVKLVVENDESDPTKAPTVIRKLLDEGSNALILQSAGAAVMQAKPVVQEAGIIAIAPTSISQTVAQPPDADYTYVLANPLSDFVKVYCAGFAAAGIKSLAVLSDNTPTIEGVNKLLLPGLKECVDVVAEETAPVDTSDVNAQVARMKDANPDAVLVSSVGGNFEVLAQNTLFEQMPDVTRFSLASIGNQPSSWELANPGALEGLIFMASIDPTNPRTKELEAFLKPLRDSDWAMTAYDAQAYDTIQLIKMAIENAGSTDPKAVSDALNAITGYQPHFGQSSFTLSFSPEKHVGTDGLCGLSLVQFGADNTPEGPWANNPPCE
jgi:branched-chain amino acid transport system substrate-binding protein